MKLILSVQVSLSFIIYQPPGLCFPLTRVNNVRLCIVNILELELIFTGCASQYILSGVLNVGAPLASLFYGQGHTQNR